jgi:hypothetical protein
VRTFLSRGLLLGFAIVLALAFVEAVLQIGSLVADVTAHHSLVSRLADRRAWLALHCAPRRAEPPRPSPRPTPLRRDAAQLRA